MCAITGLHSRTEDAITEEQWLRFCKMVALAKERGRDSFGLVAFDKEGCQLFEHKIIGDNVEEVYGLFREGIYRAIANNRAEPTTEYVIEKRIEDVQPYSDDNGTITIVHNGTIANDKELAKEYDLHLATKIDSAVIPGVLKANVKQTDSSYLNELKTALNEQFVGSFALGIYDQRRPENLVLAANYKPLFVRNLENVAYFSSLQEHMYDAPGIEKFDMGGAVHKLPAYSILDIGPLWSGSTLLPLRDEKENKKALVVCSGGLDSTTVAQVMKNDGYDVTLLHFKYKCRAEEREVEAIRAIAERMEVELIEVGTDIFKDVIKHSPLTDSADAEIAQGDKGVEWAHEWVPARNLIMLSIATGIAEGYGFDVLALGNNLEESGAYPDNEQIFIKEFADVLPYAVNADKRVEVLMPVGNLMKHEIVKLGMEAKAPLDITWSCYENGEKHCGTCGPCRMRKVGFEMAGLKDPMEYLSD